MMTGGVEKARVKLEEAGIQVSVQRLAIADYVLFTDEHPNAEQVLERVLKNLPMVSRATVYNTLNLFVQQGLLNELAIHQGHVVFDPELRPHHHFVDTESGEIIDVPQSVVDVAPFSSEIRQGSEELHIRDVQVVLRGIRRPSPDKPPESRADH